MSVPNLSFSPNLTADAVVVGAGLIGLATALELHARGADVTVIERGRSLMGASTAAAGMLAVDDPHNPPELHPLSQLSAQLYPGFLSRIEALSGIEVPFQTDTTVQYLPDDTRIQLAEHSLDPRQLAAAVLAAVKKTSIRLLEETQIDGIRETSEGLSIEILGGPHIRSKAVIYAAGAWTSAAVAGLHRGAVSIIPRKGQMLRVRLPAKLALHEVHRSENVYIVPRCHGPQAGTALIGATVEDAAFDTSVRADDLGHLRALAARLLPAFASETDAPLVESWAGLRPVTPDCLPMLGAFGGAGQFIATGHYRNGILLAPATAAVISDLIEGKAPSVDISVFSPERFSIRKNLL